MKRYIINYIRIDGYRNTLVVTGIVELTNMLKDLTDGDAGIVVEIFTSNL